MHGWQKCEIVFCCCLVTKLCPNLMTSWTVAHQAPLPKGFPRQEYWSGLSFPSPGHLPDPGIKAVSPALVGGFLPLNHHGSPLLHVTELK